ncbi:PAS domain S-box protein, partial [Paracidovorax oryzae]
MQRISSLNIVDLLLDAVCIVEADSTIIFVSPAFERIFGYAPKEVAGKRMLDMVHPEDLPATQDQVQRITGGQLQLHFENRYIRKDGRIAHIRWTARLLEEHNVRLAVAHDITERKSTEALQAAIYGISEATHAEQTLESLFSCIHRIIGRLLPAANLSVALYDASAQTLSFPYHANEHHPAPPPLPLAEAPLHAEVIRTGRTLLLAPDAAEAHAPHQPHSWLGVPLQTS